MENDHLKSQSEQELSEEQLFREISKAVAESDIDALDRLAVPEPTPEPEKVEEEEEEAKTEEGDKTPEPEVQVDDKDTEIAKLKEELDKQSRTVHQLRSDAGRVPALQRRLAELDKKLQEVAAAPKKSAAEAREDTRVLNEKLAQIKEADPLLAEAIEASIDALRQEQDSKLAATHKLLESQAKKTDEELFEKEWTKLVTAVPNAQEVFEHPLWEEWKGQIPPNLHNLATSIYADEVMLALEQFTKFVVSKHPELAPKQEPAKEEPKQPEPVVKDPAAERLAAEREKKLKTPTPGSSNAVVEKDSLPTDPDKLFAHFFNLETNKFKR